MDFSVINPALFIAVPLLMAFVTAIIKKADKALLTLAVVVNVAYAIFSVVIYAGTVVYTVGGFKPPFGISLVVDGYALVGVVLLNVVFALIVLMSFKQIGKFASILLVALAALNGVVLTGDLFNLFVFIEIASITAYILTTMNKGFKHTFNYLVVGTFASGLYLLGIVIIYNLFGTLNIVHLSTQIGGVAYSAMILPLILIFAGLSVEAKLIPFSGWVRGVVKDANGLVGALLLSAYAAAMLLMFGRLITTVFVLTSGLKLALTLVAVVTLTLAEAAAFGKRNLREILLFSSIAQSGLVIALFLNGLTLPALLVLVNTVVSKMVMFTISAKLAEDVGTDRIYDLKGVFAQYRCLGIGFTVAAMSMVGLPLFFGFVAKANVLVSLMMSGNLWIPIIILLVSVIEGIYFIRILTSLWNVGEEGEMAKLENVKDYKLNNYVRIGVVALAVALLIVAAGVLPLENILEYFDAEFILMLGGA